MNTEAIVERYSELANTECCLSCGNNSTYSKVKVGETAVDLGSGQGTEVLRIAEAVGENGFVYGIDITEEMIESSKRKALKLGIHNVSFIKSDLEKIELPDETADIVVSNCTINHVNDKNAVWSEIFRILKKGGRFVISDIYATEEVPQIYSSNPELVAECWAGALTREKYLEVLKQSGFNDVNILEESAPYDKGKIKTVSFTISGSREKSCCCR